ncbi:MAG: ABC transporter permease [Halanaerobiales bacterium]
MNRVKIYRLSLLLSLLIILTYTFVKLPSATIKEVLTLLKEHLVMVGISMSFATIIGVTTGILLSRSIFKKYSNIAMYIVGLGQTIPSLAVLALTMSLLGIGLKPAIFALTIYTVLPIARNTLSGLSSVSSELVDAARGLGIPPLKILREIEIPNALSVIIAGIRTALIINIGTAALGSLVGAGGLGEQIFTGITFLDPWIMLSGALPTAILALLGDYTLRWIENVSISEGLKN